MNELNLLKVINYLSNNKEATVEQICLGVNLKQPEVSIGCTELLDRKWILSRRENRPGKGRPYYIYKLGKYSIEQIKEFLRIKYDEEYKTKVMEMYKYLKGEIKNENIMQE